MCATQHKTTSLLKTLWDFFFAIFMSLDCAVLTRKLYRWHHITTARTGYTWTKVFSKSKMFNEQLALRDGAPVLNSELKEMLSRYGWPWLSIWTSEKHCWKRPLGSIQIEETQSLLGHPISLGILLPSTVLRIKSKRVLPLKLPPHTYFVLLWRCSIAAIKMSEGWFPALKKQKVLQWR